MAYEQALQCLADPMRRRVFEKLRAGSASVAVLAQGLPVSRPAVSQHLKALKAAGLVNDRPKGTRRVYAIDPNGLGPLRAWVDQLWDQALESFQREVEKPARPAPRRRP
jgi:DNA-binding transcriptional ArsR family regulator